jgi:hypothetical protein
MEQSPSWEANQWTLQLVKNFPAFMETRKSLTVPTSARHLSFVSGCVILSLETLPTGDPSGGVVYLRIVLSPEKASLLMGNS